MGLRFLKRYSDNTGPEVDRDLTLGGTEVDGRVGGRGPMTVSGT